jgi:uncharacterized protein
MASITNLIRGTGSEYFVLFERAGANVARAGELLEEMLAGFPDTHGMAQAIRECQRHGDQITHELIRRMNETFVTPIDREDILGLASALDAIAGCTEAVADYLGLYKIEALMAPAQSLAHVLGQATEQIALAIPLLRGCRDISAHTLEVHRLEHVGDRVVRAAIASLFEAEVDPMVVIRWKDLFERLEQAIDSTARAADILDGVVIKNA